MIATIPYLFLILRIRFLHQLHFIGWVCHTWISYLNVVLFTERSQQPRRWYARSWSGFTNFFSWCSHSSSWHQHGVDNVVPANSRGITGVVVDEGIPWDWCERCVQHVITELSSEDASVKEGGFSAKKQRRG